MFHVAGDDNMRLCRQTAFKNPVIVFFCADNGYFYTRLNKR